MPRIFHSRTCLQYGPVSRQTGTIPADEAIESAVTGDVWLFRGSRIADRAVRIATNAPVNHVAMVVALDDLPPLLWHTELGQSLEDVWTGDHHRGAQLHRLDEAYRVWTGKYGQRAYVRQFTGEVTRAMEDELLRVISAYDGRPFPTTRGSDGTLAGRPRPPRGDRGGGVLRAAAGDHVPADGPARPQAPGQLVRPGQVLERRSAAACRRRPPGRRDRCRIDSVPSERWDRAVHAGSVGMSSSCRWRRADRRARRRRVG